MHHLYFVGGVSLGGVFQSHDLFARGGGLGVSGAWAYEVLTMATSAMTTKDISEAASISRDTARRALKRLAHHGVVTQSDAGWQVGSVSLHEAARRRGSAGATEELMERHRLERRDYLGYEEKPNGSLTWYVQGTPERRQCSAATAAGRRCKAYAMRNEG